MRSNQVTIKDIARQLGISASTVSRALKDHPDISIETKKAVNELSKKLNYHPNAVALSLKSSKRYTIGIIIPETVHYFFSTVISGIEEVAHEAGYNVMICQSNEHKDRELSNAQMLYSNRVDGILVSLSKETINYDYFRFIQDNNIPVVFFDRSPINSAFDEVIIDDYHAAYNATMLLVKSGYKKLAHFSTLQNIKIGVDRKEGFLKALYDSGLQFNPRHLVLSDNFASAKESVYSLFNSDDKPDGIFAVNDLTAMGALFALKTLGIKVPDEVGIVGFSNGQYSEITDPPLSTIDQNGYKMGKDAAELLLKRINNGFSQYKPETHFIETEVIVRSSTR